MQVLDVLLRILPLLAPAGRTLKDSGLEEKNEKKKKRNKLNIHKEKKEKEKEKERHRWADPWQKQACACVPEGIPSPLDVSMIPSHFDGSLSCSPFEKPPLIHAPRRPQIALSVSVETSCLSRSSSW